MKNQLISGSSHFYQYIERKNIEDLAHFRRKEEEWTSMEEACAAKKDDLNAATYPSMGKNTAWPPRPPKIE